MSHFITGPENHPRRPSFGDRALGPFSNLSLLFILVRVSFGNWALGPRWNFRPLILVVEVLIW